MQVIESAPRIESKETVNYVGAEIGVQVASINFGKPVADDFFYLIKKINAMKLKEPKLFSDFGLISVLPRRLDTAK